MQEDAAPRNLNDMFGRVVGSALEFGHSWSRLTSLSCFCPALAVQNKLQIDMLSFLADIIHGFSRIVCHRLTDG